MGEFVRLPDWNSGRESKIILIPFQLGAAIASMYLIYSRVEMCRRARRSWQAISSRLTQVWDDAAKTELPLGLDNPWALYRDAGAMMEIADYAERNARNIDHVLIEELRSDALQIRLSALKIFLTHMPVA